MIPQLAAVDHFMLELNVLAGRKIILKGWLPSPPFGRRELIRRSRDMCDIVLIEWHKTCLSNSGMHRADHPQINFVRGCSISRPRWPKEEFYVLYR